MSGTSGAGAVSGRRCRRRLGVVPIAAACAALVLLASCSSTPAGSSTTTSRPAAGTTSSPPTTSTGRESTTTTTTSTPAVVALEDCGVGSPLVRPSSLTLACADDNERGISVHWTSWTPTAASGTGMVTWNVCSPDCAESRRWDRTAASFELTDARQVSPGRWLFEELVVDVTGPIPSAFPDFERHQTFTERPL